LANFILVQGSQGLIEGPGDRSQCWKGWNNQKEGIKHPASRIACSYELCKGQSGDFFEVGFRGYVVFL
jgi:hypothetical protein